MHHKPVVAFPALILPLALDHLHTTWPDHGPLQSQKNPLMLHPYLPNARGRFCENNTNIAKSNQVARKQLENHATSQAFQQTGESHGWAHQGIQAATRRCWRARARTPSAPRRASDPTHPDYPTPRSFSECSAPHSTKTQNALEKRG